LCLSRLSIYKSELFYLLNRLIHTLRVTFNVGKNLQNLYLSPIHHTTKYFFCVLYVFFLKQIHRAICGIEIVMLDLIYRRREIA